MGSGSIKAWAEDDRPSFKLLEKGVKALSDAELLSILIGTGTKKESAVDIARNMLQAINNDLYEFGRQSVKDYMKIPGIGETKAVSISAAVELGRRRKETCFRQRTIVITSRDCYECLAPLITDLRHEEFWILLLNRSNVLIGKRKVSEGGVHGTVVDPKIVFRHAIETGASSIILCHNHPSGSIKPSQNDIQLTQKIRTGGLFLEIAVLDHLIIGENAYYSFSDDGM